MLGQNPTGFELVRERTQVFVSACDSVLRDGIASQLRGNGIELVDERRLDSGVVAVSPGTAASSAWLSVSDAAALCIRGTYPVPAPPATGPGWAVGPALPPSHGRYAPQAQKDESSALL